MERIHSVYVIKCSAGYYVGSCSDRIYKRLARHFCEARKGSQAPLHRAIRRLGEDDFTIRALVQTKLASELRELEREAESAFVSLRVPMLNRNRCGAGPLVANVQGATAV